MSYAESSQQTYGVTGPPPAGQVLTLGYDRQTFQTRAAGAADTRLEGVMGQRPATGEFFLVERLFLGGGYLDEPGKVRGVYGWLAPYQPDPAVHLPSPNAGAEQTVYTDAGQPTVYPPWGSQEPPQYGRADVFVGDTRGANLVDYSAIPNRDVLAQAPPIYVPAGVALTVVWYVWVPAGDLNSGPFTLRQGYYGWANVQYRRCALA